MTSGDRRTSITQVKHYRLLGQIGEGGMGSVFEAADSRTGEQVAVKILHPWLVQSDPTFRDRFEREAHIAALLRSPYTVRLLDFGHTDEAFFLVMEFVDGTTVAKELASGALQPERALRIAAGVARALEEASARGVVHRDIKPDNILLTADGDVKVADFGIARQAGAAGLTSAGMFVGTPEYAAPEQSTGEADHRADIYSLGATLYCMLTGHPPFQGPTMFDILRQHRDAEVDMRPLEHLPTGVTNPVRRCLEKDPRDRYQSAAELAGALERGLAALPRSSRTGTPDTSEADKAARPAPDLDTHLREQPQAPSTRAIDRPATPPAVPASGGMPNPCDACGETNMEGSRFCRRCGRPLHASAQPASSDLAPLAPRPDAVADAPAVTRLSARVGVLPPDAVGESGSTGGADNGQRAPHGVEPAPATTSDGRPNLRLFVGLAATAVVALIVAGVVILLVKGGDTSEPPPASAGVATLTSTATAAQGVATLTASATTAQSTPAAPEPTTTATPTRVTAPTPTPKVGDAIYLNHFDAGSTAPAVLSGTATIEGGQLLLAHPAGNDRVSTVRLDTPYSDIAISARIYMPKFTHVILACRDQGTNSQYRTDIYEDVWWVRIMRTSDSQPAVTLIDKERADVIKPDTFMDVTFTCKGATLSLSVNGTLIGTVTDSTYSSGGAWIGVWAEDNRLTSARIDDLAVIRLN